MDRLRRAAVAGTWYPGQASQLAEEVDRYLAAAEVARLPQLRAVIVPHAGLMYSGPVAAFSYKAARDARYGTVVLVGPSHFVPFRGVSIWPSGRWETPFGEICIDDALAAAIAAASPVINDRADTHSREHSLEMQMPFVAHLWPGARIVPLMMGHQTRVTAFALGDAIAQAVAARTVFSHQPSDVRASAEAPDDSEQTQPIGPPPGDVLLVASSDLSHYEDARTAAAMDAVVMRHVEALDAEGLMEALERDPRHACGGGPIVSVLHAARQLGARHAQLLQYADSGDVSGDKSAVVGYMAAAVW
jgi:predicted class III extradiol MEMO1 family dioxygenase